MGLLYNRLLKLTPAQSWVEQQYSTHTHTLGLGVGPGDPRPVLLMLHPPFLLADGGVLQRAPAPALYLTAVCMRAGALLLSPPLCDATDATLSSPSNPTLPWDDTLRSSSNHKLACLPVNLCKLFHNMLKSLSASIARAQFATCQALMCMSMCCDSLSCWCL